ncbi:F0F1 ATP synthase subunit delta [Pacificimonas flava]|uniref:F0F1 ATP synthase subunit delta n=1 Tax=Pacificimonas flava TaxID=1234595 RepID=UPI000570DCAC|nr:F0F1 ATP synthase subunit delta [Pacificimonas flava]MBB5280613.1 F-type H+-transporting ATPase subunit delta [Pacificimonas flava]
MGSVVHGLGGRYATALYELAREEKREAEVEASMTTLKAALADSNELRALISSPLLGREEAARAMEAVAGRLGLHPLVVKFLGVLARNRRLAALPQIIRAYQTLAAAARGEITAEVTSAHPLTATQEDALKAQLRARYRQDVALDTRVDPDILGGLIVKVGSRLIDSSLKTKLDNIGRAMKGAA